jgi:cytochrome c
MIIYDLWNRYALRDAGERPRIRLWRTVRLFTASALGALTAGTAVVIAADPPAGPAAVYTDAQAASGRQVYYRTCANCHGETLAGKVGPALTGRQFHQMVAAQKMTAPLLFNFIATKMPQSRPGSLSPEQAAAIMAFILKQNGYPPGDTPLTADSPALGKVDLAAAHNAGG